MTQAERIAHEMMNPNSPARKEAEKMMGRAFADMTKEQRVLAAIMLAAFETEWRETK